MKLNNLYIYIYIYIYIILMNCNIKTVNQFEISHNQKSLTLFKIIIYINTQIHSYTSTYIYRSFTSMAPTTWNLLPYRLRRLKSPHVFANSLKDYLNLNLK